MIYKKNYDIKTDEAYSNKVEVLLESLPYIKEYFDKIVIVKIGGSMMENDSVLESVLNDLILMKYVGIKVVLVHGGGRQINAVSYTHLINLKRGPVCLRFFQ